MDTATINKPADMRDVAAFEAAYGVNLPLAFINLLKTFNGRKRDDNTQTNGWLSLKDIETTLANWREFLLTYYGENYSDKNGMYHNPNHVSRSLLHRGWIPFLRVDKTIWCMDFAPERMGNQGQVIRVDLGVNLAQYHVRLEADNFSQWFEQLTNRRKNRSNISHSESSTTQYTESSTLFANEIRKHIEQHVGHINAVFQEQRKSTQPIDIFWINSDKDGNSTDPFHVLVTCGMSSMPLPMTDDRPNHMRHYAELLVILPPDWPIGINVFADYRNYWPVHWLKTIARLPQRCQQWLGEGQSFSNSTSAELIANTPYGGFLLFSPLISLPEEFCVMETPDGGLLHFYALVPLTPSELRFKNNFGLEALLLQFKQNSHVATVTDRIIDNRPSLVADDTAPVEIDLESDTSSFTKINSAPLNTGSSINSEPLAIADNVFSGIMN